jgi:hypothetical protein
MAIFYLLGIAIDVAAPQAPVDATMQQLPSLCTKCGTEGKMAANSLHHLETMISPRGELIPLLKIAAPTVINNRSRGSNQCRTPSAC